MERMDTPIAGIYRDLLKQPDGTLIYDSGWTSNTIVDRCRILLTGFMKNESAAGIAYLAFGRGDPAWDSGGLPAPGPETTDLANRYPETIEAGDLELDYLDNSGQVVAGPTSRLQIRATLGPGFPAPTAPETTVPLREFGLFGRLDGVDFMINNIRHPVIHKDEAATLIRLIRLQF